MLATKNIVIELISIIICGTAIGLLMAVTANGFVQLVFLVTEYRTSLSWFDFSFQGSTYSLSSIASLLLAAIIISLIRKWLDIKNWEGIGSPTAQTRFRRKPDRLVALPDLQQKL